MHVRLVDQRGRVRPGTRTFLPNVLSAQLSQMVVDQRREAFQGLLIAASPGLQQRGDVARRVCHDDAAIGGGDGACSTVADLTPHLGIEKAGK